ncbi:MAG: hypothetical protein HY787_20975 [Deltaproteobacteria bacterium]|nr:hypothetical protein [Deltaproteobacteria bacterium]
MEAIKIQKVVNKDGEIRMTGLPFKKGQRIELILLTDPLSEESTKATARTMLNSGIVGLWKDRPIDDSVEFARQLRKDAQTRKN